MDNALLLCELFDIYGPLLTTRQQEAFTLRYLEDLSLTEIAETLSISRQGARDAILHAEEALQRAEQKLGLRSREKAIRTYLDRIDTEVGATVRPLTDGIRHHLEEAHGI